MNTSSQIFFYIQGVIYLMLFLLFCYTTILLYRNPQEPGNDQGFRPYTILTIFFGIITCLLFLMPKIYSKDVFILSDEAIIIIFFEAPFVLMTWIFCFYGTWHRIKGTVVCMLTEQRQIMENEDIKIAGISPFQNIVRVDNRGRPILPEENA
eukprot:TRINITY_DN26108_c0_g1_i1.p2 TRINITY_DN26108_c0_g1~~TRINITY_DN26108_c0_g1_i1.p2  ORF type:complete len:152 (+),score=9.77 TRINITY_DN26108_c0_g1_i1:162-617(+)